MSIPEIHLWTGAYAVDALTENERESFEHHLPACEPCTTESRSLQAATVTLAALVPVQTSPSLRERVLAQARTTAQLPPRAESAHRIRAQWAGNRLWMAVAATLTVIATGLGAVAVNASQRAQEAERLVAEQATRRPDVEIVSEATRSGGTATLVTTGEKCMFVAAGLPAPATDRTYQLWVISPTGQIESLGVLELDDHGRLERVWRSLVPGEAMALTLEPAGGSAQPTTTPLVTLAAEA